MALDEELLKEIALAMLKERIPARGESAVKAGLTYIGQLISHDIVPPTNGIHATRKVTPELNLDSIYGEAPLYLFKLDPKQTFFLNDEGLFEFNSTANGNKDLKRVNHKTALIPESRNDENVIVAQLHLFFQRLHNVVMKMRQNNGQRVANNALEARQLVTRLFHLVVIEDFLRQITNKHVFREYFKKNNTFLTDFNLKNGIPHFFSKASFRFGHSIIRRKYRLRTQGDFPELKDLLRASEQLLDEHIIEWKFFFSNEDASKSLPFDTHITDHMQNVPGIRDEQKVNVVLNNLIAGQTVKLPTGWEFVNQLLTQKNGAEISQRLKLVTCQNCQRSAFSEFSQKGLSIENLPIWPYILLESEQQSGSNKLGVFGSMLNAEVLRQSMANADFSLFIHGKYALNKAIDLIKPFDKILFDKYGQRYLSRNEESIIYNLIAFVESEESTH